MNIFPNLDSKTEPKTESQGGFYRSILEEFSSLPKSPKMTDYAVVNVAPAVVPNPYVPAFRIFSYNITGGIRNQEKPQIKKRKHGEHRTDRNHTASCESPEYRDTWQCHLDRPWNSDPSSPARTNQKWSPLGYAQVRSSN